MHGTVEGSKHSAVPDTAFDSGTEDEDLALDDPSGAEGQETSTALFKASSPHLLMRLWQEQSLHRYQGTAGRTRSFSAGWPRIWASRWRKLWRE